MQTLRPRLAAAPVETTGHVPTLQEPLLGQAAQETKEGFASNAVNQNKGAPEPAKKECCVLGEALGGGFRIDRNRLTAYQRVQLPALFSHVFEPQLVGPLSR